jgi:hypothetical protein
VEENLLGKLFRLVRSSGELIRDMPHLFLETTNENPPRLFVAAGASARELSVF